MNSYPVPRTRLWTACGLLGMALVFFPLIALLTRVPWQLLPSVWSAPDTAQQLRVTLLSSAAATGLSTLLGTGIALWLHSMRRAAGVLRLIAYVPLALPPVVAGIALTAAFGRRGVLTPLLDGTGITLAFTLVGVVLAHTFVSVPFVVAAIDQALRQYDPDIAFAARAIGLPARTIINRIYLPAIGPSVVSGAGLACARSLGEFGATLTFAGSLPGVTRTMPVGIYLARETSPDTAYALAFILIVLALIALLVAGLPLCKRAPTPLAHVLSPLDAPALWELTRPITPPTTSAPPTSSAPFPTEVFSALVGPNGAGKSTLARQLLAPGITLSTQRAALPRTTTVAGVLNMVTNDPARTQALLTAAGMATLATVPVPALSGGQAAQVALLRALATRPATLILDEPLAAVDAHRSAQWMEYLCMGADAATPRTTIMATHHPLHLAATTHTVVCADGAVVASAPTPELLRHPPTDFVAQLVGLNVLPASVVPGCGPAGRVVFSPDCVELTAAVEIEPAAAKYEPIAAESEPAAVVLAGTLHALSATALQTRVAQVKIAGNSINVPVQPHTRLPKIGSVVHCRISRSDLTTLPPI